MVDFMRCRSGGAWVSLALAAATVVSGSCCEDAGRLAHANAGPSFLRFLLPDPEGIPSKFMAAADSVVGGGGMVGVNGMVVALAAGPGCRA